MKTWDQLSTLGRLKAYNRGDSVVPAGWKPRKVALSSMAREKIKHLSSTDTIQVRTNQGIKTVPIWEVEGWIPVDELPTVRRMKIVLLADAKPFMDLGLVRHPVSGRWHKPKA